MKLIILILVIIIFIVSYKNIQKEKYIKELKNRLQQIEKDSERIKFEDAKKKEYIDSINIDINNLKDSLEYEKKEKLTLESKLVELKKQNTELEKAISKTRVKYNEEKINTIKDDEISDTDEHKSIINNIDIGNNNLNNEAEVKRNNINKLNKKNKINQKSKKTKKEQSKNVDLKSAEDNLNKNISNESLNNQDKIDTEIKDLQSKEKIIKRAKELANSNLWNDEAIKLNKSIIEFDEKNIAAHTRLAKCYVIKENYIMAEKLYKEVLTINSNNTIAKNRLHDVEILIKRQVNYKFFKVLKYLENEFKSFVTIDEFNEEFIIFYNDIYNPYRRGKNRRFREKEDGDILRLKENEIEVIEKYSNLFNLKLKNIKEILDVNNVIIISIPSSKVGKKKGINYVAENIAKKNGFLDKSNRLIRTKDIHKLSAGGRRDKDVHLNSIKYKEDNCDLSNKTIILIDDVITTGNSLIACREILMRCGAKQIVGLGIGRTYSHNS